MVASSLNHETQYGKTKALGRYREVRGVNVPDSQPLSWRLAIKIHKTSSLKTTGAASIANSRRPWKTDGNLFLESRVPLQILSETLYKSQEYRTVSQHNTGDREPILKVSVVGRTPEYRKCGRNARYEEL